MSTLKEFIRLQVSEIKNIDVQKSNQATNLAASIEKNLVLSLALTNHSAKEKFSHEVAGVVTSNDFLTELSNEIGEPKQYESEDEFVKRAKSSLVGLLQGKVLS